MERKHKCKNAAAWGSAQWVATYRWSEMDRKRRARAEKVVAAAFPEQFRRLKEAPRVCCACTALAKSMGDVGIVLPKKLQAIKDRSYGTAHSIETAIRDEVFGRLLLAAWGL